jgi:hypothetical protein
MSIFSTAYTNKHILRATILQAQTEKELLELHSHNTYLCDFDQGCNQAYRAQMISVKQRAKRPNLDMGHEGEGGYAYYFPTTDQQSF